MIKGIYATLDKRYDSFMYPLAVALQKLDPIKMMVEMKPTNISQEWKKRVFLKIINESCATCASNSQWKNSRLLTFPFASLQMEILAGYRRSGQFQIRPTASLSRHASFGKLNCFLTRLSSCEFTADEFQRRDPKLKRLWPHLKKFSI